MAYPSNVGCDFVVPTNKDTPLYLSTPYTRNELNSKLREQNLEWYISNKLII